MSEKKELNQEQLEEVSGGSDNGIINPNYPGFYGYVNMYSLTKGNEYYFVKGDYNNVKWFRAFVNDTYEHYAFFGIGYSVRYHDVRVTEAGNSSNSVGDEIAIVGDDYAAYTKKNLFSNY